MEMANVIGPNLCVEFLLPALIDMVPILSFIL